MRLLHHIHFPLCFLNISKIKDFSFTNVTFLNAEANLTFLEEDLWPNQNGIKADNSGENFLQIWDKELNQPEEKEDNIELEGPVGHVLGDFQKAHEDSFDAHQNIYNPDADSLEGFFGEAPKDFEQIIDEWSFDNCHLESCDDSQSIKYKSPTLNRSRTYNIRQQKEEGNRTKPKKRDAKRAYKKKNKGWVSKASNKNNENGSRCHNKESLKSNNSNKSGLIIKIRSGNDVIMSEEILIDQEKQSPCMTKANSEEGKVTTPDSSCSTSTLSMEQHEESRPMSDWDSSSIELENNLKIVWRGIGPLKATERRQKVLHYLEKKRSRKWHKRINYK